MRGTGACGVALFAALLAAAPVAAGEGLIVGVSDDGLRWQSAETVAVARDLGLSAVRVTLPWRAGERAVGGALAAELDAAVPAAYGTRVVVAIYGLARDAPLSEASRDDFCTYARSVLDRYPTINDVVVWNEPNLSFFWQPQFDSQQRSAAPSAYGALLANCYDKLHAARAGVNVIGPATSPRGNDRPWAPSNVSHSPETFLRRLGDGYRASGRARPLFDTLGHHIYGHSAERPWREHPEPTQVSQGDLGKLLAAVEAGFAGTAQPLPGSCAAGGRCVSVWYLEAGYQTVPDEAKRSLYEGAENDVRALPDAGISQEGNLVPADALAPDQATQLVDGVRLAYCQRAVGAYFNFLLRDEADLGRWQSGVLWADGTRKDSYGAFKAVIAEVAERRVDCGVLKRDAVVVGSVGEGAPTVSADAFRWSPWRFVARRNDRWQFGIDTTRAVSVRARIVLQKNGRHILAVSRQLSAGSSTTIRFRRRPLAPGRYRIEVWVSGRGKIVRGPAFTVLR